MKEEMNQFDISVIIEKTFYYLKKYLLLLVLVSGILAAAWYFHFIGYGGKRYIGTTLLKLDIPQDRRMDIRAEVANVVGILSTNKFMQKVIESTKLRLVLVESEIPRKKIFDYIKYSDEATTGWYTFEKGKNKLKIKLTNEALGLKDKLILSKSDISDSDTIVFNKISISFSSEFLRQNPKFELKVRMHGKKSSLAYLKQNLSNELSGRRQYLTIKFKNTDKGLAEDVTNKVAELFIEENINLKTFKIRKQIDKLTKQLTIAEKNLSVSEEKLKNFRRKYPTIVLAGEQLEEINIMNRNKIEHQRIEKIIDNIGNFIQKIRVENLEEKYADILEVLQFLVNENINSASVYTNMLTAEHRKYQDLIERYPRESQFVIEGRNSMESVIQKCMEFLKEQIKDLEQQKSKLNQEIVSLNRKLKNLPALQIELARLIREKNINEETYISIKEQLNNAKVAQSIENPDVLLIDPAIVSVATPPVIKVYFIKYIIPILLFIFIPLGLAIGLAFLDNHIFKNSQINSELGDIPVFTIPQIGRIEMIPKSHEELHRNRIDPKLTTLNYSSSLVNESFRNLRANLIKDLDYLKEKKIIMLTSYRPGEGKSLISGNLAITFAQNKIKTLLIDSDLRRGVLHNMFTVEKAPGLSNILGISVDIDDEVLSKVIQPTPVPNLFLLSSGNPVPNPSELLASKAFEKLLTLIRKKFNAVIIDTSPIGITSDSLNFIHLVDASLIVVMAKKTKIEHLKISYNKINSIKNMNVKAIILNGYNEKAMNDKYSYSYYNY